MTKYADAQVFLPLVAAIRAAGMFWHTAYIKHCDPYSVFGGQSFSP